MFTPDPFEVIYQVDDSIELNHELYSFACELESYIKGDYSIKDITEEIKSHSLAYVKKGLLAYKAKFYKLYKPIYHTFTQYCQDALGSTIWQVNRLISAAKVVLTLVSNGHTILPQNEAQARPLTKLDEATLLTVWDEITKHAPHTITANLIEQYIDEGDSNSKSIIRIDKELLEHLRDRAIEAGVSLEQYLGNISGLYDEPDQEEEDLDKEQESIKLTNWHSDLTSLTTDYDNLVTTISKLFLYAFKYDTC